MNTFTMPSDKKNFVLHITWTLEVQAENLVCESLPLRFLTIGVKLGIHRVALVDEPEVGRNLPHAQSLSAKVVLSVESSQRRL
jgi:hypothetical protein